MVRKDPALEQQSKNRRVHRRQTRMRLMRAARKRAFREHPFVCWTSIFMVVAAVVLDVIHACIATIHNGSEVSSLMWITICMIGLLQIWLAVALRLGPFSPKRKSRALFWQGLRYAFLSLAVFASFQTIFISVALLYGAISFAPMLGQRLPQFIWSGLRDHVDLICFYAAYIVGTFASLFIASRLKLLIRRLEGRCVHCDYSLRGLTEARCPECGTTFDPADLKSLKPKSARAVDE